MSMLDKLQEKGMRVDVMMRLPIVSCNFIVIMFIFAMTIAGLLTGFPPIEVGGIIFICVAMWFLGALFGGKFTLASIKKIEEDEAYDRFLEKSAQAKTNLRP